MKTVLKTITFAMITLGASSAIAYEDHDVAFSQEANNCIAAVNEKANYDHAGRIKHDVTELKNTFSGYVLSIDTRVYSEDDESLVRRYSSHCVAKGDEQPRRFKITRVNG